MLPRSTALAARRCFEDSSLALIEWDALPAWRRAAFVEMAEQLLNPTGFRARRVSRAAAQLRGLSAQDWQAAA